MSSRLPDTTARGEPENLAILLREPFRAMGELVAHLERHGYVERVPDPADGRAKLVRATARGREVFAIARAEVADVQARLTERLGARRMRELRALVADLDAAL